MNEDYFNDESQATPPPATDFFASGSPSCRFNNLGDMHKGKVVSFEEAQQRDIATSKPKFWPDGNPCQMLVIVLETAERDAEIDDDDGTRRLYVNKPSGMFAAIKNALGKNKLIAGGTLAVKYIKDGQPKQAGFNRPKEYVAQYFPPEVSGVETQKPSSAVPGANGFWTLEQATQECVKVGITRPELIDRLKLLGLKAYNPQRDTSTVKTLIEEMKVSEVFDQLPAAELDLRAEAETTF